MFSSRILAAVSCLLLLYGVSGRVCFCVGFGSSRVGVSLTGPLSLRADIEYIKSRVLRRLVVGWFPLDRTP